MTTVNTTGTTGRRSFSRRSFIIGAAALGAAGVLAGCSATTDDLTSHTADPSKAGTEEIYPGVCRGNCSGGCFLNVYVRDGQVVRTTARDLPDPQYNRICSKGLTHVGRMYGANRNLYPMKRVGERGSSDFERIGWDEAINTIVEKWTGYREKYGPQSIVVWGGTGCCGMVNGMFGYLRFTNVLGACSFAGGNVDLAVGFGWNRASGGTSLQNELTDRVNTKTVVCWGSNFAISYPHCLHFYLDVKERGGRYVVIDPVYTANTCKADWWIPLKAGTDGPLALGVVNVLLENGWVTEETLKTKTDCPYLIKDDFTLLRMSDLGVEPTVDPTTGTEVDPPAVWDETTQTAVAYTETNNPALRDVPPINGITVQTVYENAMSEISKYPPDIAAEICGIDEDDIYELARVYYEEGPVSTESNYGMDHYRNGHYSAWASILPALLTGNVGKPGTNFGNMLDTTGMMMSNFLSQYGFDSQGNMCPGAAPYALNTISMGGIMETGQLNGEPLELKSIYFTCSNAAVTDTGHDYTIDWISKFEFVVATDVCMTETCKNADIILPAAHWFEVIEFADSALTHPYMLWQDKCTEPLGESKADFEIYATILEAMGLREFWPATQEDFAKEILDTDALAAFKCDYESLRKNKVGRPHPEGSYIADTTTFATETGRIGMYAETVTPGYMIGQEIDFSIEHGLHWESPTFAGEDREYRQEYPYHVYSDHMRTHTHSQWWDCELVKDFESGPVVRINPEEAAELGIKEGDEIKLYNDNGFVVMKVAFNAGLPRKMLTSGRSWNHDDFIEGDFSGLSSYGFNQVCANQAFNDVAAQIEKL